MSKFAGDKIVFPVGNASFDALDNEDWIVDSDRTKLTFGSTGNTLKLFLRRVLSESKVLDDYLAQYIAIKGTVNITKVQNVENSSERKLPLGKHSVWFIGEEDDSDPLNEEDWFKEGILIIADEDGTPYNGSYIGVFTPDVWVIEDTVLVNAVLEFRPQVPYIYEELPEGGTYQILVSPLIWGGLNIGYCILEKTKTKEVYSLLLREEELSNLLGHNYSLEEVTQAIVYHLQQKGIQIQPYRIIDYPIWQIDLWISVT